MQYDYEVISMTVLRVCSVYPTYTSRLHVRVRRPNPDSIFRLMTIIRSANKKNGDGRREEGGGRNTLE